MPLEQERAGPLRPDNGLRTPDVHDCLERGSAARGEQFSGGVQNGGHFEDEAELRLNRL